jgi:hypothetical protein
MSFPRSIDQGFHLKRPVADGACGFGRNVDYLDYLASHDNSLNRWSRLRDARPAALFFWYRQSPAPMSTSPPTDPRFTGLLGSAAGAGPWTFAAHT